MSPGSLNCPNCGGAVDADATRCKYCGAALATVSCPSCFATAFLGSKFCPRCGAELSAAPPAIAALNCPACKAAMRVRMLDQTGLLECQRCAALWLYVVSFQKICNDREKQAVVLGDQFNT
ncbi:MAG: zinc ribbon domain-containing protein, partial [Tepidisphaeraceae bacterium]